MKINEKILSIPPYISTAWRNIASLSEKEGTLVISLRNGTNISVPALPAQTLEKIFSAHERFLEVEVTSPAKAKGGMEMSFGIPLPADGMNGVPFGSMMQHDSAQKNAPTLPDEVINKIKNITKAMGMDEMMEQMPEAEPHCNCPYCQIARAVHNEHHQEEEEESVSDEDLHFRDWEIEQIEDNLYRVTSPLDRAEQYQVFLGTPIGCTCGQKDCEHIQAVLRN